MVIYARERENNFEVSYFIKLKCHFDFSRCAQHNRIKHTLKYLFILYLIWVKAHYIRSLHSLNYVKGCIAHAKIHEHARDNETKPPLSDAGNDSSTMVGLLAAFVIKLNLFLGSINFSFVMRCHMKCSRTSMFARMSYIKDDNAHQYIENISASKNKIYFPLNKML